METLGYLPPFVPENRINSFHKSFHPREIPIQEAYMERVKEGRRKLHEEGEKRRKAILEAKKREADQRRVIKERREREYEIREKAAFKLKKMAVDSRKSEVQERLKLLLEIVSTVRARCDKGLKCKSCMFMNQPHETQCAYCGLNQLEEVSLDENYMHCIDKKYNCWNYANYSLEALPKIDKNRLQRG